MKTRKRENGKTRMKLSFLYLLIYSFTHLLILSSCSMINPETNVPAYIKVKEIKASTNYTTQGTSNQKITDVWVHVGGSFLGAYQLPANFPCLETGMQRVHLEPGIKTSGSSTTRVVYPFFEPFDSNIDLTKTSIKEINPVLHYKTDTKFKFIEGFDGSVSSYFAKSANSMPFHITHSPDSVFEGGGSFVTTPVDSSQYLYCLSKDSFVLTSGNPVWIEINYRSDIPFEIGLNVNGGDLYPYSTDVNASSNWNKLYIFLTEAVSSQSFNPPFKVYIYARSADIAKHFILLDNIKLVTF